MPIDFRLAGVDKDEATRDCIQSLNGNCADLSTELERNIQDCQIKVVTANRDFFGVSPRKWHAATHERLFAKTSGKRYSSNLLFCSGPLFSS